MPQLLLVEKQPTKLIKIEMINSIYTDDIHVVYLEMLPTSIQDFGGEYRIHRGYTEADAEKFIVDLDKAVENEKGLYVDAIAISRNVFESVCRDINSKLQELLPQQETIGLAEIYKHLNKGQRIFNSLPCLRQYLLLHQHCPKYSQTHITDRIIRR